jgi:hypothetical protein
MESLCSGFVSFGTVILYLCSYEKFDLFNSFNQVLFNSLALKVEALWCSESSINI